LHAEADSEVAAIIVRAVTKRHQTGKSGTSFTPILRISAASFAALDFL
jgi:hypothetical protein